MTCLKLVIHETLMFFRKSFHCDIACTIDQKSSIFPDGREVPHNKKSNVQKCTTKSVLIYSQIFALNVYFDKFASSGETKNDVQ